MTTEVPLSVRTPSLLGEFVRARRHEIAPEEVGIRRDKGRRRVGLSRTEVAELANISVAYYDLIERGRDLHPSRSVIDGLARALRLTADERTHLHALASGDTPRLGSEPEMLTDELEELLDAIDPNPAYVVGARWDVLGANHTARQLFSDWEGRRRKHERNLLWYYCCDPAARSLFVDWEQEAADQLALFREAYARHPDDPGFSALLDQVFADNPAAVDWWERHDTDPTRGRTKRIRLDSGEVVKLVQLVMLVSDTPDIRVISYFADADGDPDGVDPDELDDLDELDEI
ncbi:helix-turn-helix transcriptional regulator [Terracoccus luteus]|uniref:Helix-turn-helix protein n=1 Tax=Terracoccus luteus TaxID=53356 RepID=A0A495Y2M1_9MICO|nr:helix-turn-helix transcriptional regulator [Terracoccus luteus]MBB2986414.1 transcriptional regulator with XRE-family HTH domain [Terracoccus luteus]MCP2171997.1 transcriptional regulator with XRE-family HTH domain [Terracoccus luteus]RKT79163.1 helix-turn-helix protein [Terracoccus luteus]